MSIKHAKQIAIVIQHRAFFADKIIPIGLYILDNLANIKHKAIIHYFQADWVASVMWNQ